MAKQSKNETTDEGDFENAYDYLEFSLKGLRKIVDEAEDEKVKLRALAHLARTSAGLLR